MFGNNNHIAPSFDIENKFSFAKIVQLIEVNTIIEAQQSKPINLVLILTILWTWGFTKAFTYHTSSIS